MMICVARIASREAYLKMVLRLIDIIRQFRMNNCKASNFNSQSIILMLCCLMSFANVWASPFNQSPFPTPTIINSVLSFNTHPYLSQPISENEQIALQELYHLSSQPLIWVQRDDLQTNVVVFFSLLDTAPDSGLPITFYDIDKLKTIWRELLAKEQVNDFELTLFDTALSVTTLRYLSDIRYGRISQNSERFGFRRGTDYKVLTKLFLEAIRSGQVDRLTEQVEPNIGAYRQLKHALMHYRELAYSYRFPVLLFEDSVEEGERDPQLTILRHKLNVLGMLHRYVEEASDIYDSEMVEAVKHFQRLHGLNEDGIIGKKTLAALNTPLNVRVRQIELALERLRWLPELKENQGLILIDIPAFRLWAYSAGKLEENSELSMKVVVGIARKNQTPEFMADLVYLEFRPYWNVPKKSTLKEIIPSVQENPEYLQQQNMELVQYFSANAEPQPWSSDSVELLKQGAMKVRQRPGPKNSLGLVKFIFPNRFNVYMHDTPARRLFSSDRRDFSHGCIRVEQPLKLAEFVLNSRVGWQGEQIKEAMRQGDNRRVFVKNAIAVLIFYSTAMAIDNEIYFFEDIYKYDEPLIEALYPASSVEANLTASVVK